MAYAYALLLSTLAGFLFKSDKETFCACWNPCVLLWTDQKIQIRELFLKKETVIIQSGALYQLETSFMFAIWIEENVFKNRTMHASIYGMVSGASPTSTYHSDWSLLLDHIFTAVQLSGKFPKPKLSLTPWMQQKNGHIGNKNAKVGSRTKIAEL